jgi:hypothetical protein
MATLTVDFFSSLDGNGSARGWPGYWGKEGPELRDHLVRKYAQDQVLVYGATTFREFRTFSEVPSDGPLLTASRSSGVGRMDGGQAGRKGWS